MFGLMLESTHEAAMAEMQAIVLKRDDELIAAQRRIKTLEGRIERREEMIANLANDNLNLEATANAFKRRAAAAQDKIDRMTSGLRQNRKPVVGGDVATNFAA
jgi:chromosome segregation ATPase